MQVDGRVQTDDEAVSISVAKAGFAASPLSRNSWVLRTKRARGELHPSV